MKHYIEQLPLLSYESGVKHHEYTPLLPISNDVPLHLELSMLDLYAYDTTVHYSSNLVSNITMKLNSDMQNEAQWCNDQDMVLILKNRSPCLLVQTVVNPGAHEG